MNIGKASTTYGAFVNSISHKSNQQKYVFVQRKKLNSRNVGANSPSHKMGIVEVLKIVFSLKL